MKQTEILFLVLSICMAFSCRDQGSPTTPPEQPKPYHYGYLASGLIVASFQDSIALARAESFVREFGLTPMDFTNYETDPLRSGTIGVPVGLEQIWVDSLSKYPSFIRSASRLGVMEEA